MSRIFEQAEVSHLTVLSLELPCCSGLARIVKQARKIASSNVPIISVVLTLGEEAKQEERL